MIEYTDLFTHLLQSLRKQPPSRHVAISTRSSWDAGVSDATARVVATILARQLHPEHGYHACLGLLSLSRRYDCARLEAASLRALMSGAVSYHAMKLILTSGLDQHLLDEDPPTFHLPATPAHVRDAAYYQTCVTDDDAPAALMLFGDPAY